MVGNDVPRQLVFACGAVPVRVTGSWIPDAPAELPTELGAVDYVVADLLRSLRSAAVDQLQGIIVCNDSQAHLRLFYLLRTRDLGIPVQLLDLPRQDSPAAQEFSVRQFLALVDFCADLTGTRPTPDSLVQAGTGEIRLGTALERMRSRRREARCSGSSALLAYRDAGHLSVGDAASKVDAVEDHSAGGGIRVHMTGSSHPDATIYGLLEENGLYVVSEDHDTGDRSNIGTGIAHPELDVVLEALVAAHLGRIGSSSVELSASRAELTATTSAFSQADVVVGLIRTSDEAPLWDVPDQRHLLEERGLPFYFESHLEPEEVLERVHELANRITTEQVRAS